MRLGDREGLGTKVSSHTRLQSPAPRLKANGKNSKEGRREPTTSAITGKKYHPGFLAARHPSAKHIWPLNAPANPFYCGPFPFISTAKSTLFLFFIFISFVCLFTYLCGWAHDTYVCGTYVGVRGIRSCPPPYGSQELNSGHEAWQQAPVLHEPSYRAILFWVDICVASWIALL